MSYGAGCRMAVGCKNVPNQQSDGGRGQNTALNVIIYVSQDGVHVTKFGKLAQWRKCSLISANIF